MARNKPDWRISVEYYPVRGFLWFLGAIPWPLTEAVCRTILRLILLSRLHRRRILRDNLTHAFPEKTPAERADIARSTICNLARSAALFAHFPRIVPGGMASVVEAEGMHHLSDALKRGKGAIVFTAHSGCWEAMPVYTALHFPSVAVVARALDNPRMERLIARVRSCSGVRVIERHDILRDGPRFLRQNGILGILVDQNFASGGIFVDFFGRPAATTTLVSLLARRTGSAIIPMHNVWAGDKLRVICEAPLPLSDCPDKHQAVAEDTQAMTKVVEGWIREDPTQWLWLHNRWKRRPEKIPQPVGV